MRDLVWLHLSDWHQKGADFDREQVRDALIKDLAHRARIDERLENIDFIIFSGDLAWSGAKAEYDMAAQVLLDPVLEVTGVRKERLFLVPGNHDLSRNALKLIAPLLSVMKSEQEINQYLLDPDAREILFAPMKAYSRFVRKYLGDAAPEDPCYSYLRSLDVRGTSVALVGMNSAWMCAQHEWNDPRTGQKDVRDQGYLLLGETQVVAPTREAAFKKAEVKIGVLHHPTDWLNKDLSRWSVDAKLERTFQFILRGHEHVSLAAGKSGPDGSCMVISAGSVYDRREYQNGYNFVHLDLDSGKGTLFYRRYDEGRGFHKDTVTSGDDTPGYQEFDLPGKPRKPAPKPEPAPVPPIQNESGLSVYRIREPHSDDLLAALDIYSERIPPEEQLQAPDFVRWLTENQPSDFFYVAKKGEQVCGFTLVHYNVKHRLAFIPYLVAEKGVGIKYDTISSRLLAEVAKLFEPSGDLADCAGVLLEVDDPRLAPTEEQRRERIARIRLFCILAQQKKFTLRALDFDYRQPALQVPESGLPGGELPMLLMYAQRRNNGIDPTIPRARARELLDYLYKWLYPEGFSEVPAENEAYRSYLDRLHEAQVASLPESVPLMDLGKIQARCRG